MAGLDVTASVTGLPSTSDSHSSRRTAAGALLALLRPAHWVKSLLVVPLPLLDRGAWSGPAAWRVAVMTAAFILASGIVYVVNDIADRHRDRAHPTKRSRPIASRRVSVGSAATLALLLCGLLAGLLILAPDPVRPWPLLVYLPLSLLYSYRLKHLPLVDAFTVATGFALRVVQGYLATGGLISAWLVLAVFTGCLLLSLGRRRHELSAGRGEQRPALAGYSTYFIDQIIMVSVVLTAIATLLYLWTQAPIVPYRAAGVLLLGPVALFALFRYLQVVTVEAGGEDAVRTLMRDPAMVASGVAWLAIFATLVAMAP